MALSSFYVGTTKKFTVICKINGVAQNITEDTIPFTFKVNKDDPDTDAKIKKNADVTSQGADGIAIFELTPTDTAVEPADGYCDIQWIRKSGAEYVVLNQAIKLLERVSDV